MTTDDDCIIAGHDDSVGLQACAEARWSGLGHTGTKSAWDAGARTLSNWDDEMNPTIMGDAGDEMSTTVKESPWLPATNA